MHMCLRAIKPHDSPKNKTRSEGCRIYLFLKQRNHEKSKIFQARFNHIWPLSRTRAERKATRGEFPRSPGEAAQRAEVGIDPYPVCP
jgi:hypothetical protein